MDAILDLYYQNIVKSLRLLSKYNHENNRWAMNCW